jgi:hypothetical protein
VISFSARASKRSLARLRVVGWLVTIAWLTVARSAASQDDATKSTTGGRTIVLLEASPQAPESTPFLHAVRDHLGDLGVRIVTTRATDARSLIATVRAARDAAVREHAECTVWVDLPRPGEIVLYMLEPQTPHLWTRKLRARDATLAAAIERVGLIARWAVAALIEGQQVEMDPDPETVAIATVENPPAPERAPPPKTTAPAPAANMRGSLGASYTGSAFSGDIPWESGLALSVKWRIDGGLFLGAAYRFLLPAVVETPVATARVSRHPAELLVGYRAGRATLFWFAEVGAMLDYTVRATTAVAPAYDPQPESGRLSAGVSPHLGAAWLVAPRIWLTVAAGLDVFFSNSSYIVDGAPPGAAAKPWAARPRGDLGMAADLW